MVSWLCVIAAGIFLFSFSCSSYCCLSCFFYLLLDFGLWLELTGLNSTCTIILWSITCMRLLRLSEKRSMSKPAILLVHVLVQIFFFPCKNLVCFYEFTDLICNQDALLLLIMSNFVWACGPLFNRVIVRFVSLLLPLFLSLLLYFVFL